MAKADNIGSRELSPEFRKAFVQKIGGNKGKDCILYNGLLALAHADERFGHIQAYITQYPSVENKQVCFARAEIYSKDGKLIGMEEADASAANCGKMTAASFPRMACTRAKGRALRDFLNVGLVTADEINQVYEPETATAKQVGQIKRLGKEAGYTKNELLDFIEDEFDTDVINELTEEEADLAIQKLQKEIDEGTEIDLSED